MKVMLMLSAVLAGALVFSAPGLAWSDCGHDHGDRRGEHHERKHQKHHGDWDGKHHGDRHGRHHDGHCGCHGGWDGHWDGDWDGGYYFGHGVGPSRFSLETGEWLGGYDGNWDGHRGHGHGYGHSDYGVAMEIFTMNETMHVATLHGMLDENLPALFMQLMEEVTAQGLIGEDTHVGAVVPNAISEDDMTKIQVWPGVNVDADTRVAAPLQKHAIEPQSFAMFVHVGPYDKLPETWMAAFEYVQANGIELDPNGWALEQYVSDPMETPEEELITNIFLPLLHDDVAGHGRNMHHDSYKH